MMQCPSLGSQMLTVYRRHLSRYDRLVRQYSRAKDDAGLDAFLYVVRYRFLLGVHAAYVHSTVKGLLAKFGNHQEAAEALGLKHRTSISQMLRSETIEGVRLTAALDKFRDDIELPTRDVSALYGFSRATSFIKAHALDDATIEGTMSPQDFSFTVGMLASAAWDDAIRHPDPKEARRVAERIISERTVDLPLPAPKRAQPRLRPEQYVISLLRLREEWGVFAVVALTAIPECIPEDEGGEAHS